MNIYVLLFINSSIIVCLPKPIFEICVFKISSIFSQPWRRYTFLSHLATKSKISVRWIKKLVAATGGVDVFTQKILYLHSYNCSVFKIIYANVRVVAPGTVCPGMFPKNWTKQEEKWTIQKNTKKQK